jgi:hypothetical protein
MLCISCNTKLKEGIGYYSTDSGPLCIVCHDMEINTEELKLKKKFSKIIHQGIMKNQDETN